MIYQRMLAESQRLEQQIRELQAQLAACPEGKIVCTDNKTRWKWYHSNKKKLTYISKKNRQFAEQLAVKKYLSLLLEELLLEQKAISQYLRFHSEPSKNASSLLTDMPAYQELLSSYFSPISQELNQWMNAPFERNKRNPEHLLHKTISGYRVRSKSEALIDMSLHTHKLPFRYECPLQLGESTIYPDFTIRHPDTGKAYYWEHFGKMDDPHYCKNAYSKLQLYASHGIIPSIQLITTFETKAHPLDTEVVEKIIQHYFLTENA